MNEYRSIDDLPEGRLPSKTMYHVERFLPTECPRCKHPFKQQNEDWCLLLGDIVDGQKVVRETDGYDIIICSHCENYKIRLMLETYQLSDRGKIVDLMVSEGFVNFQEVQAVGTHCQDMHAKYMEIPGIRVRGIDCSVGDSDKA